MFDKNTFATQGLSTGSCTEEGMIQCIEVVDVF